MVFFCLCQLSHPLTPSIACPLLNISCRAGSLLNGHEFGCIITMAVAVFLTNKAIYTRHAIPVVALPQLHLPPPILKLASLRCHGSKLQGLGRDKERHQLAQQASKTVLYYNSTYTSDVAFVVEKVVKQYLREEGHIAVHDPILKSCTFIVRDDNGCTVPWLVLADQHTWPS